ncbi:3-hydroxyacyl-CoA dehydrogenase NAD-binding domain-containing protein [Hazenella coriacea]|uniref:3-hydroxybutyryl-CoA dehydrogenase n=1 Tax=Hazenella coriacea TaxID=1179467 RepID=A0A4R3LC62_9BACL|nr:3-hydroxyacyl-CoA dehydrogenase NAD-binding domain-containing protein [Hazenella coriacea]TCS96845.1 3-hydroxybutyryl-CoA dehydrogenase [Hazenella coriacea]
MSEKASFHQLAVIGAGTMGIGIAEFFARAGYSVQVYEKKAEVFEQSYQTMTHRLKRQVEKGKLKAEVCQEILNRIYPVSTLEDLATSDLIVEAIVEQLKVKQELFSQLDQIISPQTILATNTSSLSITAIAAETVHPERVVGLHFFNPAPIMPLVEVVVGAETNPTVVETCIDWMRKIGKSPVRVSDSPGFLVNRVARPFHLEAYRLVGEGTATKEQVDRIIRAAGFKMGPFQLQDLIGIDINYAASLSVYEGYFHESRFRPHYLQKSLVDQGALGRKTGKGHFDYDS